MAECFRDLNVSQMIQRQFWELSGHSVSPVHTRGSGLTARIRRVASKTTQYLMCNSYRWVIAFLCTCSTTACDKEQQIEQPDSDSVFYVYAIERIIYTAE